MKVIHDPVHGSIKVSTFEQALINTPQLQRLRGIQQLAMAQFAYPGANHTRFEHSLGTMHMAGRIASQLGLSREETVMVRAAGLLHDVGHPAFSHAVEDILRRNPEYCPSINGKTLSNHEAFTQYIIQEILTGDEELLKTAPESSKEYFKKLSHLAIGKTANTPAYLSQVISGDIDADRIDFLMRDSYHTGVSLGLIDTDQILESLVLEKENILLGGKDEYSEDMALIAAESLLTARAHHYSAIIHNPLTQAARAMLLYALEGSLDKIKNRLAKEEHGTTRQRRISNSIIMDFFLHSTDADLLTFIRNSGEPAELKLLTRLREGRICPLATRFNYSHLHPKTRTALAIIAQHGKYKKIFEETLARHMQEKYGRPALIDLDLASGLPRTIRVKSNNEEGFFYDHSALANGLIRAISRQLSLCIFTKNTQETQKEKLLHEIGTLTTGLPGGLSTGGRRLLHEIGTLTTKLVNFIREETTIQLEGLILLFHCANKILAEENDSYTLIPRIHNITWIYRVSHQLSQIPALTQLFSYNYTTTLDFPYSDNLYKNIQTLVAMEMLSEDLRSIEYKGTWKQRYEYTLTPNGADYAKNIDTHYARETQSITEYLQTNKHSIVRDMIKMPKRRYQA